MMNHSFQDQKKRSKAAKKLAPLVLSTSMLASSLFMAGAPAMAEEKTEHKQQVEATESIEATFKNHGKRVSGAATTLSGSSEKGNEIRSIAQSNADTNAEAPAEDGTDAEAPAEDGDNAEAPAEDTHAEWVRGVYHSLIDDYTRLVDYYDVYIANNLIETTSEGTEEQPGTEQQPSTEESQMNDEEEAAEEQVAEQEQQQGSDPEQTEADSEPVVEDTSISEVDIEDSVKANPLDTEVVEASVHTELSTSDQVEETSVNTIDTAKEESVQETDNSDVEAETEMVESTVAVETSNSVNSDDSVINEENEWSNPISTMDKLVGYYQQVLQAYVSFVSLFK
jgi:hypothetical protein